MAVVVAEKIRWMFWETFFVMIGAFVIWCASGFNGGYKDQLNAQANRHVVASLGLFSVIAILLVLFRNQAL